MISSPNRQRQCCCSVRRPSSIPCVTFRPFRVSFAFTFILLGVLQVMISCGLIWLVGYYSSLTLVNTLSTQLRGVALNQIGAEVYSHLIRPLQGVMTIEHMTYRAYPDFANATTITNRSGILADVSEMILNYPEVSAFGCGLPNGIIINAFNLQSWQEANAAYSSVISELNATGYGYSVQPVSNGTEISYYFSQHLAPSFARSGQPIPDYNSFSKLQDLGPLWFSLENWSISSRLWWQAAVAANGSYTWSPIADVFGSPNSLGIWATRAVLNNDGSVATICYGYQFMNEINSLLHSMSSTYGQHGMAVIMDSLGRPVASSVDEWNTISVLLQPVGDESDERLQDIFNTLSKEGLITDIPPPLGVPVNNYLEVNITENGVSIFGATSINYDGDLYHYQAIALNEIGLDWIVVVVTRDNDFDGGINHQNFIAGMYTLLSLAISIIITLALSCLLLRPVVLVSNYMKRVADIRDQANDPQRDNQRLAQLREIYSEWHRDTSDGSSYTADVYPLDEEKSSLAGRKHHQPSSSSSTSCHQYGTRKALHLMTEIEFMKLSFKVMLTHLIQSKEQTAKANQAKRDFIRYIFHECRVPLNAVTLGLADLSESINNSIDAKWTDADKDVLNIVSDQSQVVGRILNDVLSLHRMEDGALELQCAPFDIELLIMNTVQSFQPSLSDKTIHYDTELQSMTQFTVSLALSHQYDGRVLGDKYRIRQVLANLLSNAIKFTPVQGNISVRLVVDPSRPNKTGDEQASFTISVIDSGVGLSQQDHERLFSPYMQVSPERLQNGGGSGLGLNISLNLIRLQGGEIGHRTPESGKGSEFWFTLPLKLCRCDLLANERDDTLPLVHQPDSSQLLSPSRDQVPVSNENRRVNNVDELTVSRIDQRPMGFIDSSNPPVLLQLAAPVRRSYRVLVAEDNIPNQKLLLNLLRRFKCECDGVINGALVIDRFQKWTEDKQHRSQSIETAALIPYDCIVMDGNMPIMSGIEATRQLRALGVTVPIIAVTGNAMSEDQDEFYRAGATAFLTKPIQAKLLKALIEKHCQDSV